MTTLPVPVSPPSEVWQAADGNKELRQCEVITNITRYDFGSETGEISASEVEISIVLTQDCDLLGDFEKRSAGGEGEIDHILLMSGYTADQVKQVTRFGTKEMKPLFQNLNPRWHYLERCPVEQDLAGTGMDAIFIDFRSIFAIPTAEVYFQCAKAATSRRSTLQMPFREHFQSRAASFMSRIVLPQPHKY